MTPLNMSHASKSLVRSTRSFELAKSFQVLAVTAAIPDLSTTWGAFIGVYEIEAVNELVPLSRNNYEAYSLIQVYGLAPLKSINLIVSNYCPVNN